jgi:hypothetical protein
MAPQAAVPISWPAAVRVAVVAVLLPGLLLALAVAGGSRVVAQRPGPTPVLRRLAVA